MHTRISFLGIGSKGNAIVERIQVLSKERKDFFSFGLINDDCRQEVSNDEKKLVSFPGKEVWEEIFFSFLSFRSSKGRRSCGICKE